MKLFGYEITKAQSSKSGSREKVHHHKMVDNRLRDDATGQFNINSIEGVSKFLERYNMNNVDPLTISAVFAGTRIYAGTISQLRLQLMEERTNGDIVKIRNTKFNELMNRQPSAAWSAAKFWDRIVTDILLSGNGYALIVRNGSAPNDVDPNITRYTGRDDEPFTSVASIRYIPPEWVRPQRYTNLDRSYYELIQTTPNGQTEFGRVDQVDMLHFTFFGFDGLQGKSILETGAKQAIRMHKLIDEFSASVFEQGNLQDTFFIMKNATPEQHEKFQQNVMNRYYTGNQGRHTPRILEGDINVEKINLNLRDQQLVEAKRAIIEDIARAFALPPEALNLNANSDRTLETMTQQLRVGANPVMRDIEAELTRKLFSSRVNNGATRYVEFDVRSLARTAERDRAEIYRKGLGEPGDAGWLTPNEIRQMEGLPRVDDPMADRLMVPESMSGARDPESNTSNNNEDEENNT